MGFVAYFPVNLPSFSLLFSKELRFFEDLAIKVADSNVSGLVVNTLNFSFSPSITK